MKTCPNCGKLILHNFCRHCGSDIENGILGDFKTDFLNVFKHSDEYVYIFSVRGNQVIIKSDDLDGLKLMVKEKHYPWMDLTSPEKTPRKDTHPTPEFSTDFLKASSLQEPQIIPTASTKKKKSEDESYVPEYEISEVKE